MADLPTLTFKTGEARSVQFTITQSGSTLDVSSATLSMNLKEKATDSSSLFSKVDADFSTAQRADGIVTVNFSTANLAAAGLYLGDIKVQFTASDIRITEMFKVTIEDAAT